MSLTQLADVIVPEFYATYGGFDSMTSTALYQSGILAQNSLLDSQVSGPGQIANIPMWGDLAAANDAGGTEPNIGTDNPADVAATKKITAVDTLVRKVSVGERPLARPRIQMVHGMVPQK